METGDQARQLQTLPVVLWMATLNTYVALSRACPPDLAVERLRHGYIELMVERHAVTSRPVLVRQLDALRCTDATEEFRLVATLVAIERARPRQAD